MKGRTQLSADVLYFCSRAPPARAEEAGLQVRGSTISSEFRPASREKKPRVRKGRTGALRQAFADGWDAQWNWP